MKTEQKEQTKPGGGNTRTPPSKQVIQSKRWCFTLNNYTLEQLESIETTFAQMGILYIIGKETASTGTIHLQGYIESKKKIRPSQIKIPNLKWNKFHWEKCKGTKENNIDYCSKEKNFVSNFDKSELPIPKKWESIELYKWQENIVNILSKEPDDRTINWIWEDKGCAGKTTFQKYVYSKYKNVVILSGKGADMKNGVIEYKKTNGVLPKIVLINIPRVSKDYVSYAGIEDIKDMFFYSGKYEGGMVCGENPHVFCFANNKPDVLKMSNDRWNIIDIGVDELDV